MTQEHIILEGTQMVQKFKFFDEHFEQAMAGQAIGRVNRLFQTTDVAVFEGYWRSVYHGE